VRFETHPSLVPLQFIRPSRLPESALELQTCSRAQVILDANVSFAVVFYRAEYKIEQSTRSLALTFVRRCERYNLSEYPRCLSRSLRT